MTIYLNDEAATLAFGGGLFPSIETACLIYLCGDLGAGKTTLVRGYLRAAGFSGNVKSPTYTLVENYQIGSQNIHHFDLYRLNDPEELEWMGIRDYLDEKTVCFIEWPERGEGCLPPADVVLTLEVVNDGRRLSVIARSERGEHVLAEI